MISLIGIISATVAATMVCNASCRLSLTAKHLYDIQQTCTFGQSLCQHFVVLEDAISLHVHRAATAALKAKMCVRVIDHAEMHESLERTVMYAATRWGALQRAMHSELGSSVCSVSSGESDS